MLDANRLAEFDQLYAEIVARITKMGERALDATNNDPLKAVTVVFQALDAETLEHMSLVYAMLAVRMASDAKMKELDIS